MKLYKPEKIFIDKAVVNHPETLTILNKLKDVEKIVVTEDKDCLDYLPENSSDTFGEGKKYLYLTRQKGNFFKPCPCTQKHICCGYNFINLVTNCNYDCTYCIMQTYLNFPLIRVFVNIEDFYPEMDKVFEDNPEKFYRCGTGELTDSLSIDHITEHSIKLIKYFSQKKNAILELKTKSVNIENVLDLEHNRRIVMSWSLNSEKIASLDEKGATTLKERLMAAKKCEEKGYLVSFHFDPVIIYDDCIEDYKHTIKEIFDHVKPENIAWISIGSLRFMPELSNIMRSRFPESNIMFGEFITGEDRKKRYFKKLRKKVYGELYDYLKSFDAKLLVYFCMERQSIHEEITGEKMNSKILQDRMDERVR